jgi:hypothetical protein
MAETVGKKKLKSIINFLALFTCFTLASKSSIIASGIPQSLLELLGIQHIASLGDTYRDPPRPPSELNKLLRSNIFGLYRYTKTTALIIVMESLGPQENNKELSEWLRNSQASYFSKAISTRPDLKLLAMKDEYAFMGTLGGELRFLCNINTMDAYEYMRQHRINSSQLSQNNKNLRYCIPNLFRTIGYETHYFHDGQRNLYDRETIMPRVGFQHVNFQKTSADPLNWLARCYSRPFCGNDMNSFQNAVRVLKENKTGEPQFIHVMTIDTHAPYTGSTNIIESYKRRVSSSIRVTAKFIRQVVSLNKNIDIYIISDHPAPLEKAFKDLKSSKPRKESLPRNFFFYITSHEDKKDIHIR